jgi:hypothetical protein
MTARMKLLAVLVVLAACGNGSTGGGKRSDTKRGGGVASINMRGVDPAHQEHEADELATVLQLAARADP